MPKPKEILSNAYAVSSNTPQTLYERIAGMRNTCSLRSSTRRIERPRTLINSPRRIAPAQQLPTFGHWALSFIPFRQSSCHQFWGNHPSSMPDPVHSLLSRICSSCNDDGHLEEEVGNEEAQQAEQRNNLHRDATSAGRLRSKAILGSALLSAACHVPLAQTRGCLLL